MMHTPFFAELAFRGWFPVWLGIALMALSIAGAVFVYLKEAGRMPILVRLGLAGLRGMTLATIALLLLRPSLNYTSSNEVPRPIALAVDDTESMLTRDARLSSAEKWRVAVAYGLVPIDSPIPENPSGNDLPDLPEKPTRLEIARRLLELPKLKLLEALAEKGPVQPSTFGVRRNGKDPRSNDWIAKLDGQEQRTALADSLIDLLRRDDDELPAAIVLLSDGRENASERSLAELGRECARRQVPVYVVGIGSSSFSQLQLRDAGVPETLFVDDNVSIPVRYRVQGAHGGKVVIKVKLNGVEVATKTIDAKEGGDLREVLQFVPTKEQAERGRQDVVTTVTLIDGPDSHTDSIVKTVRVVDQKVKVLVVDGSPRWDFKFLQRALSPERNRRVEASFYLFDGDPRAMKSGPPFITSFPSTRPELFKYDLLVVGDVAANSFTRDQQEMIRDFVAEGGGFLQIAGRNRGPSSFIGTPLADVLPVEIDPLRYDSSARPVPFRPQLTPSGIRSPMLSLDDDAVENLRIWPSLPEIYWHYPVRKLKPAAEAFLVHPRVTMPGGGQMPLLAAHYYGKGYSAFVAFDETWRWRYNEADRFFARFWSQAVYVTGVPRTLGTKLTQLSLDTPDPLLGRTGTLYARLFTQELRPVTADKLQGRLENLDAPAGSTDRVTPVELRALPGQPGEYIASIPFDRVGRFSLKVDNGQDQANLEYRVNLPPDHERAPGGMAEEELRKLAEVSGGRFYQEETIYKLAKELDSKLVTRSRREEVLLWNRWALFLIIALLTAEWVSRKWWSLS